MTLQDFPALDLAKSERKRRQPAVVGCSPVPKASWGETQNGAARMLLLQLRKSFCVVRTGDEEGVPDFDEGSPVEEGFRLPLLGQDRGHHPPVSAMQRLRIGFCRRVTGKSPAFSLHWFVEDIVDPIKREPGFPLIEPVFFNKF